MRYVTLTDDEQIPALGLGTWRMGEQHRQEQAEIDAIRLGVELGMTLVDTAEMYGEGGAERMLGKALRGIRDRVFLVSKVYPHNASRQGTITACERSLERLDTDHIDLYLLHWPGNEPLQDTVAAFEQLRGAGKIRHWGISNFDLPGMDAVVAADPAARCASNQLLYHPGERGIEWQLLPACRERGVMVMAYSPLADGGLLDHETLLTIAAKHETTAPTVVLAWVLRDTGMVAIPKATRLQHVRDNAAAMDLVLDSEDLARIDEAFPPPRAPTPLAVS